MNGIWLMTTESGKRSAYSSLPVLLKANPQLEPHRFRIYRSRQNEAQQWSGEGVTVERVPITRSADV